MIFIAQSHLTPKGGVVRRLYDWVLHWAQTPYGLFALIIVAFSESSFFPVPPDPLLITMGLALPHRAFVYALICSISSTIGGCFGYALGWGLWESLAPFFFTYVPGFTPRLFDLVQSKYDQYSFWVVFTADFTPIPYKVFTLAAGVFGINLWIFLLASGLSRSARFFLIGFLIWKFGAPVKSFIDRYFNFLSIAFVLLMLLGFAMIKLAL